MISMIKTKIRQMKTPYKSYQRSMYGPLILMLFISLLNTYTLEAQVDSTFSQKNELQYFVVPLGVDTIKMMVVGADGGSIFRGKNGGSGASAMATFEVNTGDTLVVVVGEAGVAGGGGGSGVMKPHRIH